MFSIRGYCALRLRLMVRGIGLRVRCQGVRVRFKISGCGLRMSSIPEREAFAVRDDRSRVAWLWEGYYESRRCSRDTYPESYITKYTSVLR